MSQALAGVRVIDMTHNQAGPACTQILGVLGADVIKLEEPKGGDIARRNMRDLDGDSLFFLLLNANKKSLTLNLKTDEGKELFRQVIAKSDVLVENFGPGALDRVRIVRLAELSHLAFGRRQGGADARVVTAVEAQHRRLDGRQRRQVLGCRPVVDDSRIERRLRVAFHNIGDEDLSHMSNWFACMRSGNKKTNATVDNGFLHAVAVIMAAQSYWQGKRLYYDSAAEQSRDSAPTH